MVCSAESFCVDCVDIEISFYDSIIWHHTECTAFFMRAVKDASDFKVPVTYTNFTAPEG